jgi:hypothetical protein
VLAAMLGVGNGGEQAAHLVGGQRDEVARVWQGVVITRRRCPGRLSTAAGAPLSCGDLQERWPSPLDRN